MAANLTPQYLEAEADYKKAQTAEERLACLKKMYSLLPKHKASEKLQADLKTKISEAKDEVERDKKHRRKTGVSYKIPKQGAGQYVILGAPNVGKSRLLTRLTRAAPEVAPYPFTTHEPHAGMMDWQDVLVQLIDTPPITADYLEGYLPGMIQSADAALLLVDLGDDDGPFAAETVIERLAKTKTNLVGDPNTSGSDQDRAAISPAHPDARWFNGSAFANPGAGQFGNSPRTIGDARWQFRRNVDLVFAKDTRFAGSHTGEVRFEILNVTNTPKFGNYPSINAVNLSSFGRVDIQAGFMRIWQLSFRYRF